MKSNEAELLPQGNEKILLVEDDPSVRDIAHSLLVRLGYTVVMAENGKEAWNHLKEDPAFDLILSDIVMPEMSGTELFRRLKETHPELRVALLSGYDVGDEVKKLHLEGLAGFIEKPFISIIFAQKVRQILDAPHKK